MRKLRLRLIINSFLGSDDRLLFRFFSSRRRHTRCSRDWSSDVCSSDLAEIPAVIFDVQRVGPSTGLPTRTAQGDLLSTALLSHGDTKHPMLFPSSCEECFTMAKIGRARVGKECRSRWSAYH